MLILTFEEFNNKFNIDNNAMSDIRIKVIGKDISLTPIEIVMRDETPDSIRETASPIRKPNFNIIVNLHPTDGTHWVLVIRREGGPVYYFDSFGVETPPLILEEYVDLGSNERIQQYDESYCGAYCLYMIYLIDRGFRIKSALNILVNQCKYPGIYNECFCLGCKVNDKYNVNDNDKDNDNDNDLRSSFAKNVKDKYNNNDNVNDNDNDNGVDNVIYNDNVNDLRSSCANNVNDNVNVNDNDNVNVKDNDDVNDNDNDNDNDLRSSFTNNDNDNINDNDNVIDNDIIIYQGTCFADLLNKKHGETSVEPVPGWRKSYQKGKLNNKECLTNTISININDDLQSWLNDDDIITEATFPDNFRCMISGPSECGKTFLSRKLILASIYFDKLYIIGPTGGQYNGLERINQKKAIIEFIKYIKDIPTPDKLPKDLKKLMLFDDVRAKEPIINEYFCRGRHNKCNMIYLNQNLFSLDRQSVRKNCNLFILFEQRGKVLASIYHDFFNNVEFSYNDFANICNKVWKEPYNYIVIAITKTKKNINGKLRINWNRRVL